MKKTAQNLIEDLVLTAKSNGLAHLQTEDDYYDGRIITINKRTLINFGLCSYFGLEIDPRLKRGAIDAIERFGIHFSCSRAYVSTSPFKEMEHLVQQIFDAPIAMSTSLSLGHHSVMPVVVGENDAIILDQQVHSSVRDAALKMQGLGVKVTVVRHNDLNELKQKIDELTPYYDKVWYMIDGVYSMYGDYAPIKALYELMLKNKKFHLYADDAHGMGWVGAKGKGYILSQVDLHPRLILATSLNKAFGAGGGVFVFSDKEVCDRVKSCGTSFIFSAPHSLPVLGAAIESAKIFLSDELEVMQKNLADRVNYCQKLLEEYNLPVISNRETPIFFIGLGLVRVGYNILNRLLDDGFYANLSSYPAVPENCTGMRFTITLHHTFEDIEAFVKSIAYHFPRVLQEEGRTVEDIHRAFRKVLLVNGNNKEYSKVLVRSQFKVQHETSIHEMPPQIWDSLFAGRGNIDWNGLSILEKAFSGNEKKEDNCNFHYYIIRDKKGVPVVASYFTECLSKDDMLAPASVSAAIELKRKDDPYSFTSRTFMMGSMISEGDHLYINRSNPEWRKALMLLIDVIWKQHDKQDTSTLLLRDFNANDTELCTFFKEQGLVRVNLPDTHVVEYTPSQNTEEYIKQLNSERRYYLNKRVLKQEAIYKTEIVRKPGEKLLQQFYELYLNISRKALEVNVFPLPFKFFQEMASNEQVEFISILPNEVNTEDRAPVGMAINYISGESYHFLLTGMDYEYQGQDVYAQILWQIICRARSLNLKHTTLGFTASQNKRKLGAKAIEKVAFVQLNDDYNFALLDIMPCKKSTSV
jgi:7-keto-8-aminopelargonate synthetase-like enzyme